MAQPDAGRLAALVKAEALRLGFNRAGITSPDPPLHLDVFNGWLQAGQHGEMAYLATERARRLRADPRHILPECRSILVVAKDYGPPRPGGGRARVAAYALGEDYHATLVPPLQAIVAALEAEVGGAVPHRIYVDTGPLLERELAQRAGLGWIGKNTCLIHPHAGSFAVLAEVLLGLRLEPDPPFQADRCGSCTRCLKACPTGCIRPDRTLDAQRCISYLTIELKTAIPEALRPALGDWLFGCDICQEVCPWNARFATSTPDPAFQPRPALREPDPRQFLGHSPGSFRESFARSPLLRAKRQGMARNAAVVAGNLGDTGNVSMVNRALTLDTSPLVRAHAAWALGRIGGPVAIEALKQARVGEADAGVRAEIEAALVRDKPGARGSFPG